MAKSIPVSLPLSSLHANKHTQAFISRSGRKNNFSDKFGLPSAQQLVFVGGKGGFNCSEFSCSFFFHFTSSHSHPHLLWAKCLPFYLLRLTFISYPDWQWLCFSSANCMLQTGVRCRWVHLCAVCSHT